PLSSSAPSRPPPPVPPPSVPPPSPPEVPPPPLPPQAGISKMRPRQGRRTAVLTLARIIGGSSPNDPAQVHDRLHRGLGRLVHDRRGTRCPSKSAGECNVSNWPCGRFRMVGVRGSGFGVRGSGFGVRTDGKQPGTELMMPSYGQECASMGPPPEGGGDRPCAGGVDVWARASMGPPPEGGGDTRTTVRARPIRCFNGAASRRRRRRRLTVNVSR